MRADADCRRREKQLLFMVLSALTVICFLFISGAGNGTGTGSGTEKNTEIFFTVLHTNDEHSAMVPHSPAIDYHPDKKNPAVGGFARLAEAVGEIRKEKEASGEPVFLFSGGDFLGGSAFAWLALQQSAAELTVMQKIGYDAVVIGNHEYDYGPDVLAEYLIAAGYPDAHRKMPVLAANTKAPPHHLLNERELFRDYRIFDLKDGIKMGVTGLIGNEALIVTADTGDFEFADMYETARQTVEDLKDKGADVILAITHAGLEDDINLARKVPGIDIIVGGHSHSVLEEPVRENDTIIVQAGHYLEYLGCLELAYNTGTGKIRVRNPDNNRPFLLPIDHRFSGLEEIEQVISEYTEEINALIAGMTQGEYACLMETVARSDFSIDNFPPIQETAVGNFVTDALRVITSEVTGKKVDVAMQADGIIRKSILPGTMPHSAGLISFYDIVDVIGLGHGYDDYPGYPVVSVYLTGDDLRRLLEVAVLMENFRDSNIFIQFSGLRYSYNPANVSLFNIPFVNLPFPTSRAVVEAGVYTGEGIQPAAESGAYTPLDFRDETIYHLVTDAYHLSFYLDYLPRIKYILPFIYFEFKDAHGETVTADNIEDVIVRHEDGRELKMWETVVKYAAAQPPGDDGIPVIPAYYADTAERITHADSFPLLTWYILAAAAFAAIILLLIRRHRLKKKSNYAGTREGCPYR